MKAASLALAALLLADAPVMAADPALFAGIPNVRFDYYEVEGRTPLEIYASMKARAPKDGDGVMGLGRTTWHLRVNWRERRRGSACEVSEPRVAVAIRILLPRLSAQSVPTREGFAFWRASLRGLEIHEAGHARIAWNHRDDFRKAAANASCRSIEKVAKATQARIVALQAEYDRATRHGQTQTPPLEM